jgi:hypothetical protein
MADKPIGRYHDRGVPEYADEVAGSTVNGGDRTCDLGEEILNVGKSFVLPVGTPLQIEVEGVTPRLNSLSVGWLPGYYLIIKQPVTGFGSIASKLFRGAKITIRYISGGDIFAFQSEVVGVTTESPRLIFISYPPLVVRRSLRGSRRVLCYLPAELIKEQHRGRGIFVELAYRGIISDISLSGCGFDMMKGSADDADGVLPEVAQNEMVKLRIEFPGLENKIELSGEIRRTLREGRRLNVGIKFLQVHESVKGRIAHYIQTIKKYSIEESQNG